MKYDSTHRFKSFADAMVFVSYISKAGFKHNGNLKNGGVVYSNGKGYNLMIYVSGL